MARFARVYEQADWPDSEVIRQGALVFSPDGSYKVGDGTSTYGDLTTVGGAVGGGVSVVSVTGTYTPDAIAGATYVLLVAGSGVLNMPTAVGNTSLYLVKNVHTSDINIFPLSGEHIEASTLLGFHTLDAYQLVSDGTKWRVVGSHINA